MEKIYILTNQQHYRKTLVRYPSSLVNWLGGNLLTRTGETMVAFVKISKNGKLVRIKEVSDKFRDKPYDWDEDE